MELKKHITNPDTGISYTLVGDYYLPDFSLDFTDKRESFGKYGKMYFDFIRNYRKPYFNYLVITSTLFDTVKDIENQCHEMLDRLIAEMSKQENVTEKLKEENQLLWVQSMNSIKNRAEEIVLNELVFS